MNRRAFLIADLKWFLAFIIIAVILNQLVGRRYKS